MVRFIRQEAEEKANEISVSAEEEFNIEKPQLVEAEKKKIRQDEYSIKLNASRINVLQAQDDMVNSMKELASKELLNMSRGYHVYKMLLKDLIVQRLVRLKKPAVILRCRKDDVHLVGSTLHSAKEEYASKVNVHPPEVFIDNVHLPSAPSHHNAHGPFCSGGAVLASRDGKIVYENTLDARLDVAFRKKLPEICKWLFGRIVMLLFYRQLWLSTVELEVERAGGLRCSVKPASRSTLHFRLHDTQSLRPGLMDQLLAWNGQARIKPLGPDSES
ncbi:hypothetical protein PTKIN_Ptkin04bG0185800 [Pterospermum kingtungense]